MIFLFECSTCFEQLCAHPQEDNCMNTTSGIITVKISEWSKITEITRIKLLRSNKIKINRIKLLD